VHVITQANFSTVIRAARFCGRFPALRASLLLLLSCAWLDGCSGDHAANPATCSSVDPCKCEGMDPGCQCDTCRNYGWCHSRPDFTHDAVTESHCSTVTDADCRSSDGPCQVNGECYATVITTASGELAGMCEARSVEDCRASTACKDVGNYGGPLTSTVWGGSCDPTAAGCGGNCNCVCSNNTAPIGKIGNSCSCDSACVTTGNGSGVSGTCT